MPPTTPRGPTGSASSSIEARHLRPARAVWNAGTPRYVICLVTQGILRDTDQVSLPIEKPDARKDSIARELRRGSLELIVLHLLEPGEAYGYEIVTKLTRETDGALEVTDGTLYPVLYRLERAGFVTVRWDTPGRGVPRKYYQLTDAGRLELAALTTEWFAFADAMARLIGPGRNP